MPTCEVCGESFLQVIKLKLHMRTHEKDAIKNARQAAAQVPPAKPPVIDKLKGNPVVLLTDATVVISKGTPKQPNAEESKGQSQVTGGLKSNSQTGQESAVKPGNLVSLKSSALAKQDTKETDNAKSSSESVLKTTGLEKNKEANEPEKSREEEMPRATRATVKAGGEGKESTPDVEKKSVVENGEKTVPATKRLPDRSRPGPKCSKKPRLESPVPVKLPKEESPVQSPVKAGIEASKLEVKDEDIEMKDLELATCPWENCTVKFRRTDLFHHMASAHDQHICEKCGEAKDSASILEEHKLKEACTSKKRKGKKGPKSNPDPETKVETNKAPKQEEDPVKTKEPQVGIEAKSVIEPTRENDKSSSLDMNSDLMMSDFEDKIMETFFDGTKCKGCPKVFRKVNKKLMVAHYENDCSGNPKYTINSYKCEKCEQLFDRKAILDNHVRLAHGSKITCDCELEFDTKQEYEHHWNTTHGRKKRQSPRNGNQNQAQASRGRVVSPRKRRPSYKDRSDSSDSSYHPSPGSVDGAKEELKQQGTGVETAAKPAETVKQNGQATNKTVTATADTTTANKVPTSTVPPPGNAYCPKKHTCKKCETVFYDKMDLAMHLLEHNNKDDEFPAAGRKYGASNKFLPTEIVQKCVVCGGGFTNTIDMIAHITKEHAENGTYPCVTCKQVFSISLELYKHTTDKHQLTYFAGGNPVPTATYTSNTRRNDDGLKCVTCQEKVNSLPELNEHMATEHPDRPWFVCSAEGCHSPYSSEKSLNRHLQKDHNIQPIRRM